MGEQVFLYCLGATEVVPLAAISYNGPFQEEGLGSYGLNESALPERLASNGTIVLGQCDTWEYAGITNAQTDVLKSSIININNWKGQSCGNGSGAFGLILFSWLGLFLSGGPALLLSIYL